MSTTVTVTLTEVDGELMLDPAGLALLFGVDIADVEHLPTVQGTTPIPREWLKRGRQRAREAQAHTNDSDWLAVMTYWASKDHGAGLEVVYR